MTLRELSGGYRAAAQPIRARLRELRIEMKTERDAERMFWLKRRTAVLTEMLRQMNELAELTEHYYERGYYRNEKYRLLRLPRPQTQPRGADAPCPPRDGGGADRNAAAGAERVLPREKEHPAARARTRRK